MGNAPKEIIIILLIMYFEKLSMFIN